MNNNDPFISTHKVEQQKAKYKVFNIDIDIISKGEKFNAESFEEYLNEKYNVDGYKLIWLNSTWQQGVFIKEE